MEITIRRATLADAKIVSAISEQTFYDTFKDTCTGEDMQSFLSSYFNLKQVQAELKNENDFYFLAETGDKVAGYLRFMEDYSNFAFIKLWKALELKRIYVTKEFQGKGIAQELMQYTLDFAKQHDYQVVWLGVWENNIRAQKFYEKYGFENSGHTHDFPIGDTPQTDYWLWKFL